MYGMKPAQIFSRPSSEVCWPITIIMHLLEHAVLYTVCNMFTPLLESNRPSHETTQTELKIYPSHDLGELRFGKLPRAGSSIVILDHSSDSNTSLAVVDNREILPAVRSQFEKVEKEISYQLSCHKILQLSHPRASKCQTLTRPRWKVSLSKHQCAGWNKLWCASKRGR